MIEAASSYPDALVGNIIAGPRDTEVTVSLIAGPDQKTTEQTLELVPALLHRSITRRPLPHRRCRPARPDRAALQQRYGFLEFVDAGPAPRSPRSARRSADGSGYTWPGLAVFAPENFITRLTGVLDAEPHVFQVGINFADADQLTSASATEQAVRRAPGAGRYVLTDMVANGPAMFDTTRQDHAGGLHTASLDEVLCINDLLNGQASAP